MSDPSLRLVDVSLRFDGKRLPAVEVLRGVSLDVWPGIMTIVEGRSGSGKTSLLQIASGLLRPTSGHVEWFGETLDELSDAEQAVLRKQRFGIVLQSGGLIEWLRADENVALAHLPTGWERGFDQRIAEVLELVGLKARARHVPAELSGGEQQRLALARALFSNPDVLVIDEPTAHLDRATADRIIELICGLSRPSRAVLVATHDPRLIDVAGQHVMIEDRGS